MGLSLSIMQSVEKTVWGEGGAYLLKISVIKRAIKITSKRSLTGNVLSFMPCSFECSEYEPKQSRCWKSLLTCGSVVAPGGRG